MSRHFTIDIEGLVKRFGNRTVVDVDKLSLESGHAYALVGPNGGGKSTLLRIMAGVIEPDGGTISVRGEANRDTLKVGYMPQKSYAFGFTVAKNVALALKRDGLSKDEEAKRVRAALEAVGMSGMAQERGSGLSGGEAQRVALARMLVSNLDVVLLDEPTASMDMEGTILAERALKSYCEETGCLLLMATHAPSQARRISERILMLDGGKVVEHGDTADVLEHPQSPGGSAFLQYWSV